jgi:hypothetical protein
MQIWDVISKIANQLVTTEILQAEAAATSLPTDDFSEATLMGKKKDKKSVEKRKAKSKQDKQKKRQLKVVNQKRTQVTDVPFFPSQPMADVAAPEGFRAVSISQALVEFGKPLMGDDVGNDHKTLNEALGISNAIWNYDIISGEEATAEKQEEIKSGIIGSLKVTFGMDDDEADELFQKMIERKHHLFPEDVQPSFPMTMFIRKELSHLIAPFNYDGLDYSRDPIPPDENDQAAIEKIKKMDHYIADGADYDEWEDFYFSMEEQVQDQYEEWLNEKGLAEWSQDFASNLELFLNFIYRYMHDDLVVLKAVPHEYLEEFFSDYLLRKLIAEPHEYAVYPPAIKFFYGFLQEKGYIDEVASKGILEIIDQIEPELIEVLRERFH